MSENKHDRPAGGRGYYIGLLLCAAAIVITGFAYNAGREEPAVQTANTPAAITGEAKLPTQGTTPPESTAATEPTAGKLKTCSPVQGEVLSPYAMEVLSYNQTTRDWRTHNGIDLAAPAGTDVLAAADGEVYTVYEDDAMGHTVVIRHNDGYTSCYSSLSDKLEVKPGDKVVMGDTIGYAADSAIVESTLGSHVHFSVTHYDEPMDPEEFFVLGQ